MSSPDPRAAETLADGELDPAITAQMAALKLEEEGDFIGRYKLLQQLGEGGFGSVWMAEQTEPVRRRVALKIIKPGMDSKEVIARFEQERQALALMDHPNIARVFDGGMTPSGRPFFVMELVRGVKVTEFCDQAKLSTADRLKLFVAICHAVQHAHQKGIIHRDLKPSNIMVTLHDGVAVPKVIDFGVAKAMQAQQPLTERTLFTQFEQMIGTPLYMSPEQAEMSGLDVDTRSDIYSLGVLLYELLTGRTPFDPQDLMRQSHEEMRRRIREVEPPKPSTFVDSMAMDARMRVANHRGSDAVKLTGQIRGDLDWIVMKALEKDRTRRYETANGLAMDIQRHLAHEPVLARPPSQLYRFGRLVRRNKLVFGAAAAVVAALVAGLSLAIWSFRGEQKQRQIAEAARQSADKERATAEEQRQLAKVNAEQAVANARRAERLLYVADMNLAQQAASGNNLGRARKLLDRHRPEKGGDEDLRGWEWRLLWEQCRGDSVYLTKGKDRAYSVSFSADARRLAVGYLDGRVELWDVPSRTLIKTFQESGGTARVAFAPAGNTLLYNSDDDVLKAYDVTTATERDLAKLPGRVRDLQWSRDGQRIIVVTRAQGGRPPPNQNAVLVIEPTDGTTLHTVGLPGQGHMFFNNARLSNDHERIFLTFRPFGDPLLQCIRLSDRALLWQADSREGLNQEQYTGFTAMDLSPDGKVLATATGYSNRKVSLWEADTGRQLGTLTAHNSYVMELAFSRDGSTLATASSDETVQLWDTKTWKVAFAPLRGNSDEVHSVGFSADGQLLATGCKDGVVMLWDSRTRKPPHGRRMLPANIRWAVLLPGSKMIYAQDTDGARSLFDIATLRQTPVSLPPGEVEFAPPNFLGRDGTDGLFHLFAIGDSSVTELAVIPVGPRASRTFAYCPKKRLLAWANATNSITVSNIDDPKLRWQLTTEDDQLVPIAFDQEGHYCLAIGKGGAARLWQMTTQRRMIPAEQYLSPHGVAMFGRFRNARQSPWLERWIRAAVAWAESHPDYTPPQSLRDGSYPRSTDRAYSPDGKTFALTTEKGIAQVYNAETLNLEAVLHCQQHANFAAAFSPDGTRLAIADDFLWDLGTQQQLIFLDADGSLHWHASFSDDGSVLFVGSPEKPGHYQFWRAPSWREIEEIEANNGGWTRGP
jgi:WD40 repeat protein